MRLVRLEVLTAFSVHRVGDVIERLPSVAKSMVAARWYGRPLVKYADAVPATPEPPPEPVAPVYSGRKYKRARS